MQILPIESPPVSTASGLVSWTLTSDTDFNEGTFSYVEVGSSGGETFLNLKPIPKWTQKSPAISPNETSSHAMASIWGTDKILLSQIGAGLLETWIYDVGDNTWTKQWTKDKPGYRNNHAMATIHGTDKVLLFGGNGGSNELGDTWIYDLSVGNWSEVTPSIKPNDRMYHSMSSIWGEEKVLLFGGFNSPVTFQDTWVFHLSNNSWTRQYPSLKPSHRYRTAMTSIYNYDRVMLFGGSAGMPDDETWIYDLSANIWEQKTTSYNPNGTSYHAMATIDATDKILLFGGQNIGNETWTYDYGDNAWTVKKMIDHPTFRQGHVLDTVYGTDKALFFGGWNFNGNFKDTWIFELSSYPDLGTYISKKYDTGSNSSFKSINWVADNTANTNVKFQIRTAWADHVLKHKDFVGPDGTAGTYYTTPAEIWSGHEGDQFIQFKAYLATTNYDETPYVKSIEFSYNGIPATKLYAPGHMTVLTQNQPKFVWNYSDIDSAVQAGFHVIIDDDQAFTGVNYDSGKQASANQYWQFPMGTVYGSIPDGNWFWKVRTRDNEDSWSDYTEPRMFTIDSKAPTSSIAEPLSDGFYQSIDKVTGTALDPDDGTGLNKVEIAVIQKSNDYYWSGSDWSSDESWLTVSGTTEWSYDLSKVKWTSGIQYTVKTRATDKAGNVESPGAGRTFTLDFTNPHSTVVAPLHNSLLNKIETINGTADDSGNSGVAKVEIIIQRVYDKYYWFESEFVIFEVWHKTSGTSEWTYDSSRIKWETDLQYTIISRATDKVGNVEIPGTGSTFSYDIEPPELSISINDGAEFTITNDVTVKLNAVDTGSGLTQMSYSKDGNVWSDWEPFKSTAIFYLDYSDGTKKVYYRVMDKAGNIGLPASDTIIMDATPPQSLSILINNGANETNATKVKLIVNAFDNTSGLNQMAFRTDNMPWSDWETFAHTKTFTFEAGEGEKTVYFKVTDRAGNEALPVYSKIILKTDSGKPNGPGVKPPGETGEGREASDQGGQTSMIIIAVVIVVVIIVLLLFMWMQTKKKKTREAAEVPAIPPDGQRPPKLVPVPARKAGTGAPKPRPSLKAAPEEPETSPPQVLPISSKTHRKCPVCSSMLTGETKCVYCGWERESV
jgi:hypothetical protein